MKKFTLKICTTASCEVVRLSKDAQNIIKQMQADSGMSATKIVSECIKFAYENYEGTQEIKESE